MEILAGDIGGTHSRLVWAAVEPGTQPLIRYQADYASTDFADAHALLKRFLGEACAPVRPVRLALALPGAVRPGAVRPGTTRLTNLDWTLDPDEFKSAFGFAEVRFLNDFQAAAHGVASLGSDDLVVLNPGMPQLAGVRAITGAGTGLGVGFMTPDGAGGWHCHASEGGHIDFAPANARQDALLESLRAAHGHVSWERLVSGMGFDAIYRFCLTEAGRELPESVVDGAALGRLAQTGDGAAHAALDLFVELYGAWVGNLALLYRPAGGLYIAGGVALHLLDRMRAPALLTAALAKGRMRSVVEATPIYLITNKRLGLMGALHAGLDAARHRSRP